MLVRFYGDHSSSWVRPCDVVDGIHFKNVPRGGRPRGPKGGRVSNNVPRVDNAPVNAVGGNVSGGVGAAAAAGGGDGGHGSVLDTAITSDTTITSEEEDPRVLSLKAWGRANKK